jgi:hypothetical protein
MRSELGATMQNSISFSTLQEMTTNLRMQGTISQDDLLFMKLQALFHQSAPEPAPLSNYWGDSPWQSPCTGKIGSLVPECGSGATTVCPSPERQSQLPSSRRRFSSSDSLSGGEKSSLEQTDFWALVIQDGSIPGAGCCPARERGALAHLRWADGIEEEALLS